MKCIGKGLVLAAIVAASVEGKSCVLPSFAGESRKCKVSADCCGENECVKGTCSVDKSLTSVETAFMAHLMSNAVVNDVAESQSTLDKLAELIAEAGDKLKTASAKLKEEAKKDAEKADAKIKETAEKVKAKAKDAAEATKAKAKETKDNLRTKVEKAADAASDKVVDTAEKVGPKLKEGAEAADAKSKEIAAKGKKTMEEVKKKFGEVMHNITAKVNLVKSVEFKKKDDTPDSKAADPGYSKYFSKFMGGAGGSPDGTSSKDSKKSDDKSSTPGGFDYSKFMGGAGPSDDKKKSKGKADSTPGGFDYQKFVPGSGGASDTTKGGKKGVNSAAAPTAGGSAGGSGGFDYQKFIPGGAKGDDDKKKSKKKSVNSASSSSGGSFDWKKIMPSTNSAAADPQGDKSPFDFSKFKKMNKPNAAEIDATPPADNDPAGMPGNPAPGTKGGPCGKTPFKDFGPCKTKDLKCVANAFSTYAPGKCESKKKPESPAVNNSANSPKPGSLGGPCGKWALGKVDFGDCIEGLKCQSNEDIMVKFMGKTFGLPSQCTNATEVEEEETTVEDMAEVNDHAKEDHDDPEMAAQAALKVAETANKLALKAADEADVLAAKLKANAAKVREAAAKLLDEAKEMIEKAKTEQTTTSKSDASATAMLASSTSSSHSWAWFFIAIIAAGGVAYVWKGNRHAGYRAL